MEQGLHRAKCESGHPATYMNAPFYTKQRGPVTLWGGVPMYCHCGARVRG